MRLDTTTDDLLQAAKIGKLRQTSLAELRRMLPVLDAAGQMARLAALAHLARPIDRIALSDDRQNCHFASLFDALRRVQREVARRENARAT